MNTAFPHSQRVKSSGRLRRVALAAVLAVCLTSELRAQDLTRADALAVAESFLSHRWQPTAKNLRHGKDEDGVDVQTPDRAGAIGRPLEELWLVDRPNTGMAYKWGGFDSLASFDAGVRAGRAAGDVYTQAKRRLGGAAVSSSAVGVDCSGFISRCWKLPRKHSTDSLTGISRKLGSTSDLRPADIMNQPGGHVLLFVRWKDLSKTRALFYEAAPFSKVRAKEYAVADLDSSGFSARRFRKIRD